MKSKTHQYYDKNAERWASTKTDSFYHEKPFRLFEKLLKKEDRVLDIGCAYGRDIPLFLGIGRKLVYEGFDISQKMINIAKSRYPQLKFWRADAVTFKIKKRYDAFWSSATLMHVPTAQWNRLLSNIESNMKAGAVGYISLPSERPNPASTEDPRHFETFDKKKFSSIVERRGWKVVQSGKLGPTTRSLWSWFIVKLP